MKTKDLENLSMIYEGVRNGMNNLMTEMAGAAGSGGGSLPQIPGWQLENTQNGDIHVLHEETGLNLEFTTNGELNNPDGPAVWYTTPNEGLIEIYFRDGKKHREDGPAVLLKNGYEEFYIDDQNLSKQEFENRVARRRTAAQVGADDEDLGAVAGAF